jgi:hypothetical protein
LGKEFAAELIKEDPSLAPHINIDTAPPTAHDPGINQLRVDAMRGSAYAAMGNGARGGTRIPGAL